MFDGNSRLERRNTPREPLSIYAISVVAIICVTMLSIVAIVIFRPEQIGVIATIIAFIAPTVIGFITLMKQIRTGNTVFDLKDAVNYRFKEYMEEAKEIALEKGKKTPRVPTEKQLEEKKIIETINGKGSE